MPNRDKKLAELAAIAQLFGSVNGPQVRQQESQQQNALAILGLLMQQQHQQAQGALQTSALDQQKQAEANRQGEFWQGTYGLHQQQLADASKEREADRTAKLDAEKAAAARTFLTQYGSMPGVTPMDFTAAATDMKIPGTDVAYQHMKDAITHKAASGMQGALGPIYQQFGKEPQKAQVALDQIWQQPNMQDPGVQEVLRPWLQQQNEGLTTGAPAARASIPSALGAGIRHLPVAAATGLQAVDTGIGNAYGDFIASLFNVQTPKVDPNQKVRPWGPFSK